MDFSPLKSLSLSQEQTNGVVIPLRPGSVSPTDATLFVHGELDRGMLFDRYETKVRGVLIRLLGVVSDLDDLTQEVFVQVLTSVRRLRDKEKLEPFVLAIAVHTARGRIRREQRFRWLKLRIAESPPPTSYEDLDQSVRDAMKSTLAIVRDLPTEERIAFSLRFLEGMEVNDVAAYCDVSRSTIKRRLKRAEQRFFARAENVPALRSWLAGVRQ